MKKVVIVLMSSLMATNVVHAMVPHEVLDKESGVQKKNPFYTKFEGEDRKKALDILADKYHALSLWFGCSRDPSECIPNDDALRDRAMELCLAYEDLLHEISSKVPLEKRLIPPEKRITYLEERIRLARQGKHLPQNYKSLPIDDVWEGNGAFKGYKVLKAYAKVAQPTLLWPGNIYISQLRFALLKYKSDKYNLLTTLPKISEADLKKYIEIAVNCGLLACEEEEKIKKSLANKQPQLLSRSERVPSENLPPSKEVNFSTLIKVDAAPKVPKRDDSELDEPIVIPSSLVETDGTERPVGNAPGKRVHEESSSNKHEQRHVSGRNDRIESVISSARSLLRAKPKPFTLVLTTEQTDEIQMLITDAGMSEEAAYNIVVGLENLLDKYDL